MYEDGMNKVCRLNRLEYQTYLLSHQNKWNRLIHVMSCLFAVMAGVTAFVSLNWALFIFGVVLAYFFSWIGHFLFEKNIPASFGSPLKAILFDLQMAFDALRYRRLFFERKTSGDSNV